MSRIALRTVASSHEFSLKWDIVVLRACAVLALLCALGAPGLAQGTGGMTPPGLAPGKPEGSYSISGIENVNLFSGNVNFNLPLLKVGGRGRAGASMNLSLNNSRWEILMTKQNDLEEAPILPPYVHNKNDLGQIIYSTDRLCAPAQQWGNWNGMPSTPFCSESGYGIGGTSGTSDAVRLVRTNIQTKYQFYPVWKPEGGWDGGAPIGYGPGVVRGRLTTAWEERQYSDPNDPRYYEPKYHRWQSLYRLTFSDSDGTEHDLVDTRTGGLPIMHRFDERIDRGRIFASNDGSAMTFISDAAVSDPEVATPPTGYLFFSDGTRCRVVDGLIQWTRDSNGNVISYTYGNDGRVVEIKDSLGRLVLVAYANMTTIMYDEIRFNGVGGTLDRSIRVWHAQMKDALRPDQSIRTVGDLFPGTNRNNSADLIAGEFNPYVVSKVELPDGRSYQLKYNSYGEIARADLPTGMAIEYNYPDVVFTGIKIHRRLGARRVSIDGGLTWESKQVYGQTQVAVASDTVEGRLTASTVEVHDLKGGIDKVVSRENHFFHGDPLFAQAPNLFYPSWLDGREYKVENLDTMSGAVLRTMETDWEQTAPVPWWANFFNGIYKPTPENAPPNNPRIAETRVILENGAVSRKTFKYSTGASIDPAPLYAYSLLTDTYEYDYALPGEAARLLRQTHTDYVKALSVNGTTYDYGCDPVTTCGQSAEADKLIHIRNLPQAIEVTDGLTSKVVSRKEFLYDEAGRLSDDYGSLPIDFPGWVEPSIPVRGNLTTSRAWLDTLGGYENAQAYLVSHVDYDRFGNSVRTWDPRGNVSEVKFADKFKYALPTETSIDPDGKEGPKSPLTSSSVYDFNSGALLSTTDANGRITTAKYNDVLGRLTEINRPDGGWTIYEYGDQVGNLFLRTRTLQESSPVQKILESYKFFDAMGRGTLSTSRTSDTTWVATATEYDGVGRVVNDSNPFESIGAAGTIPDAPLFWTTTEYDALGRTWKVTMPDGAKVYTLSNSQRTLATDHAGRQRLSQTDALGRLTDVWEIKTADPATESVNFPVPQDVPVPAVSAGYRTSYSYDALGNLRKVEQGAQRRYFAYDSLSRLIRARNPEQDARAELGLTAALLSPLSDANNAWSLKYEYDESGNLRKETDARGVFSEDTYDALNRAVYRHYSDGTPDVTYVYDDIAIPNSRGRLTSVSSSVSTYKYNAYDVMGRVKSSSQITDGITYQISDYSYDLAGNLTSQTYPSGRVVSTAYDSAGRLSQVAGQRTGETVRTYASAFSYSAHGALTEVKLGNNLWEHTRFNERLQPTLIGLGTSQGTATAQDYNRFRVDYEYGGTANNGNVIRQHILVPDATGNTVAQMTQAYDYDELNRLAAANEGNITTPCRDQSGAVTACWKQTYQYDRFGNRRFKQTQTTLPAINDYNQNAVNPASSEVNNQLSGIGYEYDAAGNLKCDPAHPCNQTSGAPYYEYDSENRLLRNGGGANINDTASATYYYDGEGRRIKKSVGSTATVFVYDAMGRLVAEYDNSIQSNSGGTSYLTTDYLGTPRVITDANGNVMARHDYLPFGEEIGLTGGRTAPQGYVVDNVRQKFTGKERDSETQLDYFQARYYSSTPGRFTSVDPLLASGETGDPQTWNRYGYVLNNPLRFIDPTGMRAEPTEFQQEQEEQKKRQEKDLKPDELTKVIEEYNAKLVKVHEDFKACTIMATNDMKSDKLGIAHPWRIFKAGALGALAGGAGLDGLTKTLRNGTPLPKAGFIGAAIGGTALAWQEYDSQMDKLKSVWSRYVGKVENCVVGFYRDVPSLSSKVQAQENERALRAGEAKLRIVEVRSRNVPNAVQWIREQKRSWLLR